MHVPPSAPGVSAGATVGGRYRLGALLGRGGMAEVYDAVDLRLERPVAVKLLRREMAAREDVRSRFQAEARAAAGLSHPNAVAVFDTGEKDGVPFLVMERLPGETLADRIAAGPVDPAWLSGAAVGVLGALAAAHTAGIVHRDVKPGNILLAADGTAKIADFGIAKSISPGDGAGTGAHADLTATGQLLGTPAYLAPERIEGLPATPRSDLWALGVVLYEALAGEKPFVGPSPIAVAHAIVDGRHVPLADRRPDVDPRLVGTIERAMATRPEERFATAGEMATALSGGDGVTAATLDQRPLRDGTLVLPAPSLHAPRRLSRPRAGLVWAAVGGLAFVLLLILVRADRPAEVSTLGQTAPSTAAPARTTAAPATAAPTTATPGHALASSLRDFAGKLDLTRDGARAADLGAALRRVADSVESGSPGAGTEATGAIITVAAWNQTGQLGTTVAVNAIELLRQVPGVSVEVQPTPQAPATTARGTSNGKGKSKNGED